MESQNPEKNRYNSQIRDYLLGNITDEQIRENIEESIMVDQDFYDELLFAENELIDEYLRGELTSAEHRSFEENFLISEERRKKLSFGKALDKYVSSQFAELSAEKKLLPKPKPGDFFGRLFGINLSPAGVIAGLLIIGLTAASIWYFVRQSDKSDESLSALNQSYRAERSVESRISEMNYAPFSKVRGGTEETTDVRERNRAELIILERIKENPTAENFHALGRIYLVRKNFSEALESFAKAEQLSSPSAALLNDTGAAQLEKYQSLSADEAAKQSELPFDALENFNNAIASDSHFAAAYFNRANCLEVLSLSAEAAKAWQKYLEIDSVSPWADEARKHLQILEKKTSVEVSNLNLEESFINAFQRRDDDAAFALAGRNREIIKENYLPQRLAFSFLEAEDEKKNEKLAALRYLGELEKKRNGDRYASDLADYYGSVPKEKIPLLKEAKTALKNGYKFCLEKNDFGAAKQEFERAFNLFTQAGNKIEAETISRYFIAYCFYVLDDRQEADRLFKKITEFCEARKYGWFALMNRYWQLGGEESLGKRSITNTKKEYEIALGEARRIGDAYMTQKFLLSLIWKSNFFRQETKMFDYIGKLLAFSDNPYYSSRQRIRNYGEIIQAAGKSRFKFFGKAVAEQSLALAATVDDPSFLIEAEINAGIVNTQAEDFQTAEKWFAQAGKNAEKLPEEYTRNIYSATILLNQGYLEQKRNNLPQAVDYFDRSALISEQMRTARNLYETRKASLIANESLGNDEIVDREIPKVLSLAEEYRKKILSQQERNTFFDNEEIVYDTAISHELRRARPETAYDYAEKSNSRSLLDWLKTSVAVSGAEQNSEPVFSGVAEPLKLNQIREKSPAATQILQYRVLQDKVAIWVVAKEKFVSLASPVGAAELENKVKNYLHLLETKDAAKSEEIQNAARELFKILIEPALPYLERNREICVIPNRILFYLPFAALVNGEGKYFLEDFALFYAPSANVFISATENAARKSTTDFEENLLSIGNPAFDRKQYPFLADLPEAAEEAEEAAGFYPQSKVFLNQNATSEAFRRNYKDYSVIHFAGHYLAEPDSPLSSRLVMSHAADGENSLSNADLLREKLPKTRLVVLSACQTGIENYYGGEGAIGLARTFLATGVPLVVASQWKVDSTATAELMKKFHYYRRLEKLSSTHALQKAQMETASNGNFRLPYYWAAFSVSGGHADF